jgi:hypothetical protein
VDPRLQIEKITCQQVEKLQHLRKIEMRGEQLSRQKIADNARTYEKQDENQRKHELIVLRILGYRSSREKLWKRALYFGR